VEKRFSNGLYLLNSFTWSKALDDAAQSEDGGGNCSNCGNAIPSVQNLYDWQADHGISAYNHPFVDSTSLVWTLPVGQGQWLLPNLNHAWNRILGGWQMTDIFQARSGDPLTMAYSPNNNTQVSTLITIDGRNAYRPNQNGPAVASSKVYDPSVERHHVPQLRQLLHPIGQCALRRLAPRCRPWFRVLAARYGPDQGLPHHRKGSPAVPRRSLQHLTWRDLRLDQLNPTRTRAAVRWQDRFLGLCPLVVVSLWVADKARPIPKTTQRNLLIMRRFRYVKSHVRRDSLGKDGRYFVASGHRQST
jgi:hypothetical protein